MASSSGLSEIERMRASLPPDELRARLKQLKPEELQVLAYDWKLWRRPAQVAPAWDWGTWLILAGRGFGKTRVGAEQVRAWKQAGIARVNLIGPTADDVRDAMIEGESGILAICPPNERPVYVKSARSLEWPDGSKSLLFSAEEPDRLRNKQHDKIWADEVAAWRYAEDSWDQAQFGLRLGANPQTVATTTPRPTKFIRTILAEATTAVTRGSTYENRSNLAPGFYAKIIKKYEGTRLGRQELNAEVLDDNPGALWKLSDIEATRIHRRRDYVRIVVALDPATTSDPDSDEWGLVVAGKLESGDHFDVLEDASGIYTPDGAAKRAVQLYWQWEADRVIGEANNGGDMIEALLRHVDPNVSYRKVIASRGKQVRAEPISALYEQHRVHHVGAFPALEDQLTTWDPATAEKSPDRLDALVWALTELSTEKGEGFAGYYEKQRVKYEKARTESKMALPKDVRQWSPEIRQLAIEIPAAITEQRWNGGFGRELTEWVEFCRSNGGGDRLKFAQKELQRLEKKFGKVTQEVG